MAIFKLKRNDGDLFVAKTHGVGLVAKDEAVQKGEDAPGLRSTGLSSDALMYRSMMALCARP